jgi:hypothetical protein
VVVPKKAIDLRAADIKAMLGAIDQGVKFLREGVPGNPGTPTINRSLLLVGDIHLLRWEFRKFVNRPMRARTKIDVAAEPQIA